MVPVIAGVIGGTIGLVAVICVIVVVVNECGPSSGNSPRKAFDSEQRNNSDDYALMQDVVLNEHDL